MKTTIKQSKLKTFKTMKKLLFSTVLLFVLMSGKSNAQVTPTFSLCCPSLPRTQTKSNEVYIVVPIILVFTISITAIAHIQYKKKKRKNVSGTNVYVPYTPISNLGLFQDSLINRSEEIPIQYKIHNIFKTACLPARQVLQAGRKSEI